MPPLEMFDEVRIVRSPATDTSGHADATGTVFGITTPSVTGVEVIGDGGEDVAINVDFGGRISSAWFAPDLVVFAARPPADLSIGGKRLSRSPDGDWHAKSPRPWWKLWG